MVLLGAIIISYPPDQAPLPSPRSGPPRHYIHRLRVTPHSYETEFNLQERLHRFMVGNRTADVCVCARARAFMRACVNTN